MPSFLGYLVPALLMVLFFGLCILLHELGHLLAAKWRGLHIDRFSVGFGPAVARWHHRGVEYRLSWIPFGGYVALPQLEPTDTLESAAGQALPPIKPLDRILVTLAGPLANVLFGLLLSLIVWQVGYWQEAPTPAFTVGWIHADYRGPDGLIRPTPEYAAGLRPGDELVAIDGQPLQGGEQEALELLLFNHGRQRTVAYRRGGETHTATYDIVRNPNYQRPVPLPFMGAEPRQGVSLGPPLPGSAAARAGLKHGDQVLTVNGEPVSTPAMLVARLDACKPFLEPKPLLVTVIRKGELTHIPGVAASRTAPQTFACSFQYAARPAPNTRFVVAWLPEIYERERILYSSSLYAAGLRPGDEIVAVAGQPLSGGYAELQAQLQKLAPSGGHLEFERGGQRLRLTFGPLPGADREPKLLATILPALPAAVTTVPPSAPAGLQPGDLIAAVNGEPVTSLEGLTAQIEAWRTGKGKPAQALTAKLGIHRATRQGSETLAVDVAPQEVTKDGARYFEFGLPAVPPQIRVHPAPLAQIQYILRTTAKTLRILFDPQNPVGPRDMSGPIGIGVNIYKTFALDFILGLRFVVFITYSLAIFNLLPLPVLDGGHIVIGLSEGLLRRKLPPRLLQPLFYVFIVLLLGLAAFVTYHDIRPALPKWPTPQPGVSPAAAPAAPVPAAPAAPASP